VLVKKSFRKNKNLELNKKIYDGFVDNSMSSQLQKKFEFKIKLLGYNFEHLTWPFDL
jgi:hypothetical protein